MITLRTPVGLLHAIDGLAGRRQVTRSALVAGVLEEFVAEIRRRGCLVPPYQEDGILHDLRLRRRRQAMLRYYFAPGQRRFRS